MKYLLAIFCFLSTLAYGQHLNFNEYDLAEPGQLVDGIRLTNVTARFATNLTGAALTQVTNIANGISGTGATLAQVTNAIDALSVLQQGGTGVGLLITNPILSGGFRVTNGTANFGRQSITNVGSLMVGTNGGTTIYQDSDFNTIISNENGGIVIRPRGGDPTLHVRGGIGAFGEVDCVSAYVTNNLGVGGDISTTLLDVSGFTTLGAGASLGDDLIGNGHYILNIAKITVTNTGYTTIDGGNVTASATVSVGNLLQFTGNEIQRPMIQYPLSYPNSPISMVECSTNLLFMLSPNDTVMFSTSPSGFAFKDWGGTSVIQSTPNDFNLIAFGGVANLISCGTSFYEMNDFNNQQFLFENSHELTLYAGNHQVLDGDNNSGTVTLSTPSGGTVVQADTNSLTATFSYTIAGNGSGITNLSTSADTWAQIAANSSHGVDGGYLSVADDGTVGSTLDGQMLQNIDAGALSSGTISGARLPAGVPTSRTTIVLTNFAAGTTYSNSYNTVIQVSSDAAMTTAGVAGMVQLSLEVPGGRTNRASLLTAIGVVTGVTTNPVTAGNVPIAGTWKYRDTSSGAGDSAVPVNGQILLLP